MLLVVFTGHSITMCFKSDSRDPTRTIMSKTRLFWRSVHCTVDWLHPAYLQPSNCTLMTAGINMHVTRIVGVYCLKPFFYIYLSVVKCSNVFNCIPTFYTSNYIIVLFCFHAVPAKVQLYCGFIYFVSLQQWVI